MLDKISERLIKEYPLWNWQIIFDTVSILSKREFPDEESFYITCRNHCMAIEYEKNHKVSNRNMEAKEKLKR